ncbi:hypothetical protein [Pseudooceanicola sp. MF1-13]|uniref:hypothetical protein n=1 Tax=Pseudooceanicola sp. MF1-13 TaxID=3379095 RepID=UPI0038929B51
MIHSPSGLIGVLVTIAVLLFCGLSLFLGWGAGVDALVRMGPYGNAIVPATSLCLMLLGLATLPVPALSRVQKLSIAVGLVAIAIFAFVRDGRIIGLFVYTPGPEDGLSHATIIGLLLLAVSPAIRLGFLPLDREWTFHVPLFGLLFSVVAIFGISFDAYYFDQIEPFVNLSHYTALAMICLFAAQLMTYEPAPDDHHMSDWVS